MYQTGLQIGSCSYITAVILTCSAPGEKCYYVISNKTFIVICRLIQKASYDNIFLCLIFSLIHILDANTRILMKIIYKTFFQITKMVHIASFSTYFKTDETGKCYNFSI